jgi:hypothetical protein
MTGIVDLERVERLWAGEGFAVESPRGPIGWVAEVWLDDRSRSCALALRTVDGRRTLPLAEQFAAVDRERQSIVVEHIRRCSNSTRRA